MSEGVLIALIMAGFGLIGSVINGIMIYRTKKLGNNPFPCKENKEKIKELDDKIEDALQRISRIEGRLNSR